jgi:RNA polymerase sigma factor FliA
VECQELSAQIRHAVASLPEKQRFVVERYFYKETKLYEIADELGVTPSWVSKLLSAALKALREMMESQGIGAGG